MHEPRLENFKLALRFTLDRPRQDDENTRTAGATAHTIRSVAKYAVHISEPELEHLNTITARLNRREPGMTDKNCLRLSQFDDETVLQRFLDFSVAEIDRLRRKCVRTRNEAVALSILIALEILIHVPLRISNLAGLRIGESLRLPARGQSGEAVIFVPRRKVKNRQPLQFVLPEEATALVRYYVDKVKRLLENEPTDILFPNKSGGMKRPDTMSKQISALVNEKLGIEFNPHLVRHLAAKLNVDERPGNYEVPRRLLVHKSSDTTYSSYEGLETKSAIKMHGDLIKSKRRYVPLSERPRARRRIKTMACRAKGM